MNKKTIIGLTLTGLVLAGIGIGIYWHRKKKKNQNAILPNEPNTFGSNYDKLPVIIELKKQVDSVNRTMFDMCPAPQGRTTWRIVNCTTGNEYNSDLLRGTWVILKKKIKSITSELEKNTTDDKVIKHGKLIIKGVSNTLDRKFDPVYYNTNSDWYKDYLKKGGTAI